MSGSSIIIDVIMILVILLMTYLAAKRGFVKTVISLVGFVIAAFVANFLAAQLAQLVYDSFISADVSSKIATTILEAGGITAGIAGVKELVTGLPIPFTDMGVVAGQIDSMGSSLSSDVNVAAEQIADSVVAPIATPLIQALLFIVFFIVLGILVSIVARIISRGINMVPIVGGINKFLGAIVGVAQGLILVFLIAMVINLALQGSGDFWVFSEQSIDGTFLFKHFYNLM